MTTQARTNLEKQKQSIAHVLECPRCGGKGSIPNPVYVGFKLRCARKEKGISLREMARRMKITPAFLSDVELGRRSFGPNREQLFYFFLEGKCTEAMEQNQPQ